MTSASAAGPKWIEVERTQFHELWATPPSIVVVAVAPGWGKTQWMRQFAAHLTLTSPDTVVRNLATRSATSSFLEAEPPDSPTIVFVDHFPITASDPLWQSLAQRASSDLRFVVASLDIPSPAYFLGIDTRVLDERELGFSDDELAAVVLANSATLASDARDALAIHLHRCPLLVRRQIERVKARKATQIWASVEFTYERALIEHLLDRLPSSETTTSAFTALLRRGAAYRRFSVEMVATGDAGGDLAAQFGRLGAMPLGEFDTDDESGQEDYVWSAGAWERIKELTPAADSERNLRLALAQAAADGRVTTKLYYLLKLGDYAGADALVYDQMRRFLLFTNAITQEALLAAPADALATRPHLLLLASELRLRASGANAQSLHDAQRSLKEMPRTDHESPIGTFRMLCRRAMAAAFAGRRELALDSLERIAESLDRAEGSAVLRAADRDRAVADRLAADLFLAFWTAAQLDRHDLALIFAQLMGEYGDPADLVTRIDQLTVMTEDDFAGLRSLAADGKRPDGLEFSHAAPLVLLEEDAEREAMERAHPVASRTRNPPTRSAADALMLLSQALAAPDTLTLARIEATVARSSEFWDDKRTSSFIVFAAATAFVALKRAPLARELVRAQRSDDWFSIAAAAIAELAAGDAGAALEALERPAAATDIPRLRVISAVLRAGALLRLGFDEAAAVRLEATWHEHPGPRLMRFALRFLTPEDYLAVRGCALSAPLAEVIAASAGDRRPLGYQAFTRLTGAEREVLVLLRSGASNIEIAEARGVTSNTLRTQLRTLYRKLNVEGRAQAVATAERQGVFDA